MNKFTLATMILGESGTGKSTSLRNLNPTETFIIATVNKPLPFRNGNKLYSIFSKENFKGNYYCSDKPNKILQAIKYVNDNRPEIKVLVIDDFQFLMGNAFLERCEEKGFTKFTQIQKEAWSVINYLGSLRKNLLSFVMCHQEVGADGRIKAKTLGKMLDTHSSLEALFSMVLQTQIIDEKYMFLTNSLGASITKSPMGMFDERYIENDLVIVCKAIKDYFDIKDEDFDSVKPDYETLQFLIDHNGIKEDKIQEVLQKFNVSTIKELPVSVVMKWIKNLSEKPVDMRNE